MKKASERSEMAEEYDFSQGVRGKYAQRYAQGTNVALLEEDVARYFPDSRSVNETLRLFIRLARTGADVLSAQPEAAITAPTARK